MKKVLYVCTTFGSVKILHSLALTHFLLRGFQAKVTELEQTCAGLEKDRLALDKERTVLEKERTDLQERLATREAQLQALQQTEV